MTDPCTMVIFGATGNLAEVKLFPALYHLEVSGLLPEGMMIVCNGRSEYDHESWLQHVAGGIDRQHRDTREPQMFARFCERISYFRGDLSEPEVFDALKRELSGPKYPRNHLFYVALPVGNWPGFYDVNNAIIVVVRNFLAGG